MTRSPTVPRHVSTGQRNLIFRFDGGWTSFATGTLKGDLLEVRYSEIVLHSDFENTVYRRSQ